VVTDASKAICIVGYSMISYKDEPRHYGAFCAWQYGYSDYTGITI